MSAGDKAYIGDGVYVELENGMIRLTTENGIEATNTIFLEPKVWRALKAWVERLEKCVRSEQQAMTAAEPDANISDGNPAEYGDS